MTQPKYRNFLANIGYPWYVIANWNDTYFVTESFTEEELVSWIEMPKIKEIK